MNSNRFRRRSIRSPFSSLMSHGEPWLWLTSGSLAISLIMIVGLLVFITIRGGSNFWPRTLYEIILLDGEKSLGEVTSRETDSSNSKDGHDNTRRRLVRTANFEVTGAHYKWFDEKEIASTQQPKFATAVERLEDGRFHGFPVRLMENGIAVASDPETAWAKYKEIAPSIRQRFREANRIDRHERGELQRRLRSARLAVFNARLHHEDDSQIVMDARDEEERVRSEVAEISSRLDKKVDSLRRDNSSWEFEFETASGHRMTLPVEEIVQAWQPNRLGFFGKLGVYWSRWWEFLSDDPREANSAGGVFPAICGTVSMTLIMALLVAPFGVLAALYLREYATDGPLTAAVRIAINNLAGVPSIVYGAFGVGFFCYGVGGWIDDVFFSASLLADNQPTFGTGGLLWASLTLALLTLPVVIVATEEALVAVPNSMREGSYACGASKWQTIRRIVLPRALPGIMTGLILAMARGAGEVAPLMLVGVKKVALDLPIDTSFPFIHPEREFMHLAYLVYDVGFQSPNSQAAKPMVFTITLLLVAIIAVLNIAAIYIRSRLKRRYTLQQF
ncbi:MAG TPA: phosphate ABC transporter permease PtsA [Planctomycetaceae bacterium]|nr:phosphate ABC transporter permease PtsA [Planctomycetaceae bacterium]